VRSSLLALAANTSLSHFPRRYFSKSGYDFPIIRLDQWSRARKELSGSFRSEQDQLKVIVNFPKLLPQSLFRPFYEAASIPSYRS
jgi:hypothetical protein